IRMVSMGLGPGAWRPLLAIVSALLSCSITGCSSSEPGVSAPEAKHLGGYGVTATVPAEWHWVPTRHLPGAIVPLEIASFRASGAVRTICAPQAIVKQIPSGGALLQILEESGSTARRARAPGVVSAAGPPSDYEPLPKPFRLGAPRSDHECGEA